MVLILSFKCSGVYYHFLYRLSCLGVDWSVLLSIACRCTPLIWTAFMQHIERTRCSESGALVFLAFSRVPLWERPSVSVHKDRLIDSIAWLLAVWSSWPAAEFHPPPKNPKHLSHLRTNLSLTLSSLHPAVALVWRVLRISCSSSSVRIQEREGTGNGARAATVPRGWKTVMYSGCISRL